MSLEVLQRVYGNTRQIFRNGRRKFEYLRRFCANDARKWSEWQDLNLTIAAAQLQRHDPKAYNDEFILVTLST
jgi:hypothetical protein